MQEVQNMLDVVHDLDTTSLPWPKVSTSETIDVLRFLLGASLMEQQQEQVELNNVAWCFTAGTDFRPSGVRSWTVLQRRVEAGAVYFTPNTFYSRRRKDAGSLRWLNSFYVDIDDAEISVLDVLERAREAGLPAPSVINKTPYGMHVYWKLNRVRATKKALSLYSALLRSVATAMDGDLAAATPERFLRIPRCYLYYNKAEYTMQDFCDWTELNGIEIFPRQQQGGQARRGGRITSTTRGATVPVEGVCRGMRNNTAFTYALKLYAQGVSQDEALDVLTTWNLQNDPPMRLSELQATVRSAFSGRYHGPSWQWMGAREQAKSAKTKKVPALQRARAKLFVAIKASRNGLRTCNMKHLAVRLGTSERTLYRAISALQNRFIYQETKRSGKKGTVTMFLHVNHVLTLPNCSYTYGGISKDNVQEFSEKEEGVLSKGGGVNSS